ncbi:methyltransferase domain-containing protein [Cyclobacterium qasimii]|uniref:SAM-dependent methyltransferase n=2 Tax=Cyclobacterium qasimii TaxID=1350429 RepID=S7VEG1_9BACT|nr:class I SAM-dependent methyltransferase [Cyclobacterium qasimii]EPR68615.1 SAM-dependent methyltransferase [Cyclobacterium qasimii M12-11B]GEO23499.1 tellurite resistance protein [Cyclobacterium qasimii]
MNKFYEKSALIPNLILIHFLNKYDGKIIDKKAYDLGSGNGNDALYLLKNNWDVIGVDKNNESRYFIERNIPNKYELKFKFEHSDIKDLSWQNISLINACFVFPFMKKTCFYLIWSPMCKVLKTDSFFVGNFLGLNDDWKHVNLFSENEIKNLFYNFNILHFKEYENDSVTIEQRLKHWHVYEIIAQKI